MNSTQILTTLGYITLSIIVMYFVFGLLKISGQGISSGAIVEGMASKQQEKVSEKLEQFQELLEEMKTRSNDMRSKALPEDLDEIKSSLKEWLKLQTQLKTDMLCTYVINAYKNKGNKIGGMLKMIKTKGIGSVEEIIELKKFITLLGDDDDDE